MSTAKWQNIADSKNFFNPGTYPRKSQKIVKNAHSAAAVHEMKVSNDKLRDLMWTVFITITI